MTNSCDHIKFMPSNHLYVREGGSHSAGEHVRSLRRDGSYTESGNMPAWAARDSRIFWDAADQHERKNSSRYVEVVVAMPRVLNEEHRAELVREFVQILLGERHAYTWAFHNPLARDRLERPHVHIMFTERLNDAIARGPHEFFRRWNSAEPEKGGAGKIRYLVTKRSVCALREEWVMTVRHFMSFRGIEAQLLRLIEDDLPRYPSLSQRAVGFCHSDTPRP